MTGGAGFIGANLGRELLRRDEVDEVVALDDLSTGDASRVDPGATFVEGSVLDGVGLRKALAEHGVSGVVHIAAKKQVGESVADPLLYWHENLTGLVTLLQACRDQGVDRIAPVRIGRGAWLGENAVIMPGVTVGRGAVIGANAVVREDVPDYSVAVGVPARVIRTFA